MPGTLIEIANAFNSANSGVTNLTAGDIIKSELAGAGNRIANVAVGAANLLIAMSPGDAELIEPVKPFTPVSNYFGQRGGDTADGLMSVSGARGIGGGVAGLLEKGAAAQLIDPAVVRFSQSSGKAAFSEGGSVQGMADALKSGTLKPNQVPAIRLVERDGVLFTLDNRRLEAFRRAGVNVPYRMATPAEAAAEGWKFTTKNGGTSLRVRGE